MSRRASHGVRLRLEDLPGDACPACGKEIPLTRHVNAVYCSPECGIRARNAHVAARRAALRTGLTCPECGSAFSAPRTLAQIYCSAECKARSMRRRWQAKPASQASIARKRAKEAAERAARASAARSCLTCPECDVTFDAPKTRRQRFCSPRCQGRSADRRRIPRRCPE